MSGTHWVLVGTPVNYEKTRELGWKIAGVKSRHRKKAERMQVGDKIIFYLTQRKAFGSIATITSPFFESDAPIWVSEKPGEMYPYRVQTEPDIILPIDAAIPAESLVPELEYVKRWPAEHWTLAFQGNVHVFNDHDYQLLRQRIAARAGAVAAAPHGSGG